MFTLYMMLITDLESMYSKRFTLLCLSIAV